LIHNGMFELIIKDTKIVNKLSENFNLNNEVDDLVASLPEWKRIRVRWQTTVMSNSARLLLEAYFEW
jgi:hypothetical protein